nr:hypothetical protein [Tanacetum cinerariifolium]
MNKKTHPFKRSWITRITVNGKNDYELKGKFLDDLLGKLNGPLANQNEDGFYYRGELSGMVQVGYVAYIQDDELYDELIDGSLKDEALKQKAIYEKSWGNASQSVINFYAWSKRDGHASYSNDVQMKGEDKERCDLFDETTRDASVYKLDTAYVDRQDTPYSVLSRNKQSSISSFKL